ncbi:MAG: nickel-dependent hydrogenase large subunit [Clostridium sp.]|uniref:hydrogenase large subunit n=1 Tax=Clostridium sp. TaxID=1506 RepID=UPI003F33DBA9
MSYIVPLGPYHPSLEEPIHVKLHVEGELIKDSEVFIGYNHRGIEKLCEEKNHIQTITLVERVCGICSHSHTLAYCLALEKISNIEVPKRGDYIRVIVCELERLHSHFLWLGLAAHIIGFDSLFMMCFKTREKIMDILEEASGNRVNYAMNTIGGTRRDISIEQGENIIKLLNEVLEEHKKITEIYTLDKTISLRTKGVGMLSFDDAIVYGACGPHGRASNMKDDVRKIDPYCSYEDFDFKTIVQSGCDVLSRVIVRILEINESIKIIKQAILNIPSGNINLGMKFRKIPEGEYMSRIEAPRGEVTYYIVSNGGQTNGRVNIHVPTFKNAQTVRKMLNGNSISDAGLIVASIDPCFSCLDR